MISRRRFSQGMLAGLGVTLLGGLAGLLSGGLRRTPHLGVQRRERPRAIRVVGVGGAGVVAAGLLHDAGLPGVRSIAMDTDARELAQSRVPTRVPLRRELRMRTNAADNAVFDRVVVEDSAEQIADVLAGAEIVFVLAGLGGWTGTGGAPVVARVARETGALSVGVVTRPFDFEGKRRREMAEQGIVNLGETMDTLCVIPLQHLLRMVGCRSSMKDTFRAADDMSVHAVWGIVELLSAEGRTGEDFADVREILGGQGLAKVGVGTASGPDKALEATRRALACPTLGEDRITNATGLLLSIVGNRNVSRSGVYEAAALVREKARKDSEIFGGQVIDESIGEDIRVTLIALIARGSMPGDPQFHKNARYGANPDPTRSKMRN